MLKLRLRGWCHAFILFSALQVIGCKANPSEVFADFDGTTLRTCGNKKLPGFEPQVLEDQCTAISASSRYTAIELTGDPPIVRLTDRISNKSKTLEGSVWPVIVENANEHTLVVAHLIGWKPSEVVGRRMKAFQLKQYSINDRRFTLSFKRNIGPEVSAVYGLTGNSKVLFVSAYWQGKPRLLEYDLSSDNLVPNVIAEGWFSPLVVSQDGVLFSSFRFGVEKDRFLVSVKGGRVTKLYNHTGARLSSLFIADDSLFAVSDRSLSASDQEVNSVTRLLATK